MWENLLRNQDVVGRFLYHLKIKKYSVKKAMSATYYEIIAVWKKVVQGATAGYTCYLSRIAVLMKLSDFYEMLKKRKTLKLL